MPRALVVGDGETSWQTGCRRRPLSRSRSLFLSLTLFMTRSFSLSLPLVSTLSDRRGLAVFNLYTHALVQAAVAIYGGVIPPWSPS